jgi:hypothetical protein
VVLNANREKAKTQTFQSLENFPVTFIADHILQGTVSRARLGFL